MNIYGGPVMTWAWTRLFAGMLRAQAGRALAVYRLGLVSLEVTGLRGALEKERDTRLAVETRAVRWRDALGEARKIGPWALYDVVAEILDE